MKNVENGYFHQRVVSVCDNFVCFVIFFIYFILNVDSNLLGTAITGLFYDIIFIFFNDVYLNIKITGEIVYHVIFV
jgi:hypothetical protein